MTALVSDTGRNWWQELRSGTATVFSTFLAGQIASSPVVERARPTHLRVSPGVSESARLVEETVKELAINMVQWLEAEEHLAEDVEHDLVVLFPPNRQYVANVRIVARRRPDILIAPDDFDTDLYE